MLVRRGEQKKIHIARVAEQEDLEIQEQGSATVYVADNARLTLSATLAGRRASLYIVGRLFGQGDVKQDITLRVVMQAPETRCRVDMRAALAGTSSSFFDGLIRAEEGAKDAAGFLSYKALLLEPGARARPIPRLEVMTREVASLGHAATVGRLNEDDVFYLRSRGLSRQGAEALIVDGFLR